MSVGNITQVIGAVVDVKIPTRPCPEGWACIGGS